MLADGARVLEAAGAEVVVLCTNTMHTVADAIAAAISVPMLHIADATASHGLDVTVPTPPERDLVHRVIYEELVRGVIDGGSRREYLAIIERMVSDGAQGVVAGCTEIELLVQSDDVAVPYFPTTRLHAVAAVDAALA